MYLNKTTKLISIFLQENRKDITVLSQVPVTKPRSEMWSDGLVIEIHLIFEAPKSDD